jgi:hypothetical protein
METIFKWILLSSKDPKKTSLFIKGLLLSSVPAIMQITGLACSLGTVCLDFDRSALEELFEGIAQLVYFATGTISALWIVWGFARKLLLTAIGKNKVIN